MVPGLVHERKLSNILEKPIQELLETETINKAQQMTEKAVGALKVTSQAAGTALTSSVALAKFGLGQLTLHPNLITGLMVGGGLLAGVKSIQNFMRAITHWYNDMREPLISWFPYAVQGVLCGGLAAGMGAEFFGKRSIFSTTEDGKSVFKLKTLIGASLAPILLSVGINLAKGQSIIRKIPFIGKPMQEIAKDLAAGIKTVTVSTDNQGQQKQGAPGGNPLAALAA